HRLLPRDLAAAAERSLAAVRCADATGDPEARAAALGVQALVEGFSGRFEEALGLFEMAMLQAEAAGALGVESRVASNRLYVLWLAGRPIDLEREAALELERRLSRGLESVADHVAVMRGIALAQLGRLSEARTALRDAIELNGSAGVRATAELTIASLDVIAGRLAEARRSVQSVAARGVAELQEVATEIVLCNWALAAAEGRWAVAAAIAAAGHQVAAGHEVSRARMLLAETRASVLAGLPLPAREDRPIMGRELVAIAAELEALHSTDAADQSAAAAAWARVPAPVEAWRCRFTVAAGAHDLAALEALGKEATDMEAGGLAAQAMAAWRDAGGRRTPRRAGGELTDREIDVLQLAGDGLTNKEIAARLHLSPRTVGVHLEHCFTKLEVSTRSAAVQEAMRRGILRPPA
ncbi:MAG: LuxR C-terminal-related transcriptional regulator, partial [Ilumatobacteraceae bacterium]